MTQISQPLSAALDTIRSELLHNNLDDAEKLLQPLIIDFPDDAETLRLNAFILKKKGQIAQYLSCLSQIREITGKTADLEHYLFELIQDKQFELAASTKSEALNKATYHKELQQLIQQENPFALANHQFFLSYTFNRLKQKMNGIAQQTLSQSDHLNRALWFIDNLFNLEAFYQLSESDIHRPSYIAYAGLTNSPFIDIEKVISKEQFSSIHADIINEVNHLITENKLVPYVKDQAGAPKGMEHLKANSDWSSLTILAGNEIKVPHAEKLVKILRENFDLADCQPMGPEVMVSILQPDTHITPHYGISNIKQTLHIPIIIPEGDLAIKSGGQQSIWPRDMPVLFDDSYLHEAWNRSSETRIVLIVDLWHPDFSSEEKIFLSKVFPLLTQWRFNSKLKP